MNKRVHWSVPLLALATACTAVSPTEFEGLQRASEPLIGVVGSDTADEQCHVVLRSAAPALDRGLPLTECKDGVCWLLFEATVQISDQALAEGATPAILYNTADWGWVEMPPLFVDGNLATFVFGPGMVRDGLSASGIAAARGEFIPFLTTATGDRVFDHNRNPGNLDNYFLAGSEGFVIADEPSVCPAAFELPTIVFDAAFEETVHGELEAGGQFVVEFDPTRLPECFGDTYMGQATWSTLANVRFGNGDAVQTEVAVACDDARCTNPAALPVTFDIPADATEVELWFHTGGRACGVHYDSDFGRNYHFDVRRPVEWVGAFEATISRAASQRCGSGDAHALGDDEGIFFGTWARQRAAITTACFRAWQPGVTDTPGGELDVSLVCDWGDGVARTYGAEFESLQGNDHRYTVSLRGIDPFGFYRCPDVPTVVEGGYEVARATCHVEANGASWGPAGEDASFELSFSDYPNDIWRANNCGG